MKWMFGLSLVWTVFGGWLLYRSTGCDPQAPGIVLQCLAANEVGDFLAGVFAPLAFIWLAYAVVLQSRELAAQRAELQLTRNEMELTREVAIEAKEATRAQAEEARKSAELFSAQTKIMSANLEGDEFARAHDEFSTLVVAFAPTIHAAANVITPNGWSMVLLKHPDEALFRESLERCNQVLKKWLSDDVDALSLGFKQLDSYAKVSSLKDIFADLKPRLSSTDQAVYKAWGLDELEESIKRLSARFDVLGDS